MYKIRESFNCVKCPVCGDVGFAPHGVTPRCSGQHNPSLAQPRMFPMFITRESMCDPKVREVFNAWAGHYLAVGMVPGASQGVGGMWSDFLSYTLENNVTHNITKDVFFSLALVEDDMLFRVDLMHANLVSRFAPYQLGEISLLRALGMVVSEGRSAGDARLETSRDYTRKSTARRLRERALKMRALLGTNKGIQVVDVDGEGEGA